MRRIKQVPGGFIPPPEGGEFGAFRIVTVPTPAETRPYVAYRGPKMREERGSELIHACPKCHETVVYRFPYEERCFHITQYALDDLQTENRRHYDQVRARFERETEHTRIVPRWMAALEEWSKC